MGCEYEAMPEEKVELGYNYFPLEVGRFSVFDAEEIKYINQVRTMRNFEVKLLIVDSFATNDVINYVINRYTRNNSEEDWDIEMAWMATIIDNQLVVQQNNISYSWLKFPITDGDEWDLNAFNTNSWNQIDPDYNLLDTCKTYIEQQWYKSENEEFPSALTVLHEQYDDFIVRKDYRFQVFEKEIGLIYHEIKTFEYAQVNINGENVIGHGIVDNGIISKQTIKEYGKE